MCCDPKEIKKALGASECIAICCGPGTFPRRFVSSKEEVEKLEEYKEQLEKEIAGVEERIKELRGE